MPARCWNSTNPMAVSGITCARSRPFDELTNDLKKQFKFLGDMGAYHFLWVVGENVPSWDEWSADHMVGPRMRESRHA